MNSVKNLSIDMLRLSDGSRKLLENLPLDEVVLLVRHENFPPRYGQVSIDYRHKIKGYDRDPRVKRAFEKLGAEMKQELSRLDMYRDDLNSDRFRMSANITALYDVVSSLYYDSAKYPIRLIRRLNNDQYENWQGYSDDTIEKVRELLKQNLTSTEYEVICMRFGLVDGRCCDWQEIAQRFGWISKSVPYYHEKNAVAKLYGVLDEFEALTKLS